MLESGAVFLWKSLSCCVIMWKKTAGTLRIAVGFTGYKSVSVVNILSEATLIGVQRIEPPSRIEGMEMKPSLLIFLTIIFISRPLLSDSPVWRVSKGEKVVFIGGTIHLLKKTDFPLPTPFAKAYKQAQVVVLETDIDAVDAPEMQRLMLKKSTYPRGRSLADDISPKTLAALKTYFAKRGMPIAGFMRFKPGFVGMMISIMELKSMGFTDKGVDQRFSDMAKADNKKRDYFETPEEQLDFIVDIGNTSPNEFIRYSIAETEEMASTMDVFRENWKSGNFDFMETKYLKLMRETFPKVYQTLIKSRNDAWLPRIKKMFSTDETEMVLVGVMHLAGQDGLLAQLKKAGFDLIEVPAIPKQGALVSTGPGRVVPSSL